MVPIIAFNVTSENNGAAKACGHVRITLTLEGDPELGAQPLIISLVPRLCHVQSDPGNDAT